MRTGCSVDMSNDMGYDPRINPGTNPNAGKGWRQRRRIQSGGNTYTPIRDILINAASGVLNKQKRRLKSGVKKRKRNVTKPWVKMGRESGAIKQKGSGIGYATKGKKRQPRNSIPVIYQYHQ